MSFRFVNENALPGDRIPPSYEVLPAAESERRAGFPESYVVSKRVMVDGDHLTNAQATFDENGRPARKSVVEGKSVSVRVDLGGRRLINNKKSTITKERWRTTNTVVS